jgi:hypothetical protein
MFPVEKPAMLNTIAKGAMGHYVPLPGSFSMFNLLDDQTLDRIAESTGKRLWRAFTSFGFASAGIMGIILIIRFIKLVVDTLIHGYALHLIYGWSLHLFGAVWTSITNLLLHLSKNPKTKEGPADQDPATMESQPTRKEGTTETTSSERVSEDADYKTLREYLRVSQEE